MRSTAPDRPARRRRTLAALAAALVTSLSPVALAQRGFEPTELPEHGLRYLEPRSYDWLPVQPDEDWIVLRYTKSSRRDAGGRPPEARFVPELVVVRIDHGEDDGATADASADDAPIRSAAQWFARRGGGWSRGDAREDRERDGFRGVAYELEPPRYARGVLAGWAYVWTKPEERTWVVLGRCERADFEEEHDVWRQVAVDLRFSEPTPARTNDVRRRWTSLYRRMDALDPEFRIRVRERLGGDWEAADTDHYIVVHHTENDELVACVLRDLEAMRAEYARLFPTAEPVDDVSTVRVCRDRAEYLLYGGMPASAGYWNPWTEELVLYDAGAAGSEADVSDTFVVLYHEAFHQYVHHSAGRLAPHPWFDEGHGDYFSGAELRGRRVLDIGPNPWRNDLVKRLVEAERTVPWDEILFYERGDYYRRGAACYAQGWSMVYFLRRARAVERDATWRNLLPTYFAALRAAWAEELAVLVAKGATADRGEVAEAQQRARRVAAERAFGGVDLEALDAAWREYVRELDWIDAPR